MGNVESGARVRVAKDSCVRWMRTLAVAAAMCGVASCAPHQALDSGFQDVEDSFDDGIDVPSDGSAYDEEDAGPPPSLLTPESLSHETIVEILRSKVYRGAGYRRVNGNLFPSTVAPGKKIDMFVSEEAFDGFMRVSPDRVGSKSTVPTGTVIVREVYDDTTLKTLTIMVKLQDGAFPLGGDFWYGAADPDGTIRKDENGVPLAGLLANCGTCHLRRSDDGFLFGTPDGYRP